MKAAVTAAFDRAEAYDDHAEAQRRIAGRLADRIAALPLPPAPRVLEVGCGTGLLGAALIDRLPDADWLMTDIAPAMVERCRARFAGRQRVRHAVMDGERPDAGGPFDLICSSLAAQWFTDLPAALDRLTALLAPGGHLIIATLAAGSFAEWQAAHPAGREPGLHPYPTVSELAALAEVEAETLTIAHADARAFLRALKGIGAATPRPGHRPLPPALLRETMRRFEAAGATASYRIAYLHRRRTA